jgi:peptide/nickel transport system substrate-binding protein
VTRHIFWQALLAVLGIALVFIILFQLVSTTPPPPEEVVEVPIAGGTYVEGVLGYSETLNPILAPSMVPANPVDQELSALLFDGLTTLDVTGRISPALALAWDVSEDGSVYDFTLRRGVTWHDGAPFTAADVAFTVQAIQDPGYQGDPSLADLWRNVRVEQLDDYTVRFTLAEPFPSFLYYTTIGLLPAHLLGAVPAGELAGDEFSTEMPVGTGRFQVDSVTPDRVVLAANERYWGAEPYLEYLEFWFYADWDGLMADYEQDNVQGFHPPGIQYLPTLVELDDLQLYSAQTAGYGLVFLNLQRESVAFFQAQEVRQALLYALDRQVLVDRILEGQGLVADSPIASISWAHDPSVRQYGHDPERAIGLLDASGWQDSDADRIRDQGGEELSFTLLTVDDPLLAGIAEAMARQWQAAGVEVEIRAVSGEVVNTFLRSRNFDAALVEIGLTADPDPYPLWHSTQAESGQNFAGFQSEEADLIMEAIRSTTDVEERLGLYHDFQQVFAEQVPALLLYYPIYTYAVDVRVREVQLSPLFYTGDRFRNVQDWYIQAIEIAANEGDELDKPGE